MLSTGGRHDAYPDDPPTCESCGADLDIDGVCQSCAAAREDDVEPEYDDRAPRDAGDWGQPGDGRYLP